MNRSDYLKTNFQIVDLASGIKAEIKLIDVMPFVLSGTLPNIFDMKKGEVDLNANDDPERIKNLTKNVILDSVRYIIFDDEEKIILVDKAQENCTEKEISYDSLKSADRFDLFNKCFELSVSGGTDGLSSFSK